jgi:hypothetical protein
MKDLIIEGEGEKIWMKGGEPFWGKGHLKKTFERILALILFII